MNVGTDLKPVLTKASFCLQKEQEEFKAFVFEESKVSKSILKETAKSKTIRSLSKGRTEKENEFNIKKARYEVLNFAINNQRTEKNRKKMRVFQLVKLGAKPQKKAYKNYKELLDERKRLKEIRGERKKFHQLGKNQTGAALVKCRSKTKVDKQIKKPPVGAIDQHYGVVRPKFKKRK